MRRFRIGSAFGIPIQLDLTFLLVLPLFAWLIGAQVGQTADLLNDVWGAGIDGAALSTGQLPWLLGVTAALGLFAGVVLHELGHSVVAMRYGFPISSITLWLFGGIAQLEEMPEDWKQELFIAIAGPTVSVALAGLSYAGFLLVPAGDAVGFAAVKFLLGYLALLNFALAIFNMLPGFPMDGGRVLRALLARNRPFARATQIAAEVGKLFALLLGLFGLFGGGGLFLVAIAFFIYIGASSEAQMTTMKAAFEGVTVRDVMTPADRVQTVDPDLSVAELMELMFRERHTGFPVTENGAVVGLVTLADARAVREVEREAFRTDEVMTTDLRTIHPDENAMTALTQMQQDNIGRLLVMEDGEFVGLLTRSDLMTALSIIKESGRDSVQSGRALNGGVPTTMARDRDREASQDDRRFED
ncbi:tRNA nucleotidyltransferase CCA-adding enzyme protein [Halorhabdus tiamatea SARL4B]|uniref:Zinc metalloprotease n=1 Tax=Halorhabdus tiamatea SARL4B TaxID=1033806 RepID=F7PNV1_9EURY|nr:CBS domain-containing protein [Halorhabdus tiamatea]ERJ06739.1 tRNA nucleotidyltransferase CCA-adding enzyme protein [Halorhabdus tiamatea SARL4B]CCQ33660.1 peptidase M50 [Halorhabdus tiamatea SARL4B]